LKTAYHNQLFGQQIRILTYGLSLHILLQFYNKTLFNINRYSKKKHIFYVQNNNAIAISCILDSVVYEQWSDMASVPNRLPSNKMISKVSYPHGLSFRPNNSRYLFL